MTPDIIRKIKSIPNSIVKTTKLYIQAITGMGYVVYTEISLPEDYTMNQVVKEVKRLGYQAFRIVEAMKMFVYI